MAGDLPRFLRALPAESGPEAVRSRVQEQDLQQWGLTGVHLRPYQLEGVNWLAQCFHYQNGCILGDEMGLGKTCQTIALLVYLVGRLNDEGPFLILCPLSVLSNWKEELERFAPGLSCVTYTGDKEERARLQQDLQQGTGFHVLLTTYEICLKDASFLKSFSWSVLAVDEAHRLKNQNSLLHRTLSEFSVVFRLLLTGTPIQNNLQELYSLLSAVEPDLFCREQVEDFVQRYQDIEKESKSASELHRLLQPFLLRRVKAQVATELPKKTEVMIYHGMSALQKKYYKAILMKDLDAFENETTKRVTLQNILTQLRKCVDHPYLFNGVEPEPFEVGEHLIEASGKLHLLDRLLAFLYSGGHRVLLFSQMTQMLDILQDYMDYRGYSYERVDGSVRGEERHLAIKNFGKQPIFVFLLSTRAAPKKTQKIAAGGVLGFGFVTVRLVEVDTVSERLASGFCRAGEAVSRSAQEQHHHPSFINTAEVLLPGLTCKCGEGLFPHERRTPIVPCSQLFAEGASALIVVDCPRQMQSSVLDLGELKRLHAPDLSVFPILLRVVIKFPQVGQ